MVTIPQVSEPQVQEDFGNEDLRRRVVLHLVSGRIELSGVNVRAEDGTITLLGKLSLFYLRQLAVERARRVAGVRQVIDNIEVCTIPRGIH